MKSLSISFGTVLTVAMAGAAPASESDLLLFGKDAAASPTTTELGFCRAQH